VIGHPVLVNALVVLGLINEGAIALQVNGTLVVIAAIFRAALGAPDARVVLQLPLNARVPVVGSSKL
jgi:hypothetical protein